MTAIGTVWNVDVSTKLEVTNCCVCGVVFAVPESLIAQRRRNTNDSYYCPNGHSLVFRKSEAEKLREQLERANRRADQNAAFARHEADQRQAAERSAAAHKGQATRLRKRVANGVCPCCNRHFANVERHMSTQHPDYATTEGNPAP